MRLYIGTADQTWLRRTDAPWCISRNRLGLIPPRARGHYLIDSGAFSEIDRFGGWVLTPAEYIKMIDFWYWRPGRPDAIGPMDYMCEDEALAKTKLGVYTHQKLTVANYFELTDRWEWSNSWAEESRIFPSIQGTDVASYLRCMDMYQQAGVDLATLPLVGLGSVCRIQATSEIIDIVTAVTESAPGIKLHTFGLKILGLRHVRNLITSTDTASWSKDAYHNPPLPGCTTHKRCVSCIDYALRWYRHRVEEFPELAAS